MKVTIDTKEDSHEDIKKVLQILAHVLEQKATGQQSEPVDTENMMSMFSDSSQKHEEKAPDFTSFLNLADKNEEKKDEGDIEFF